MFNLDLRHCALAVVLAPFAAFMVGPTAALALGVAYLVLAASVLVSERRTRVDAPGTEAGMSTLFLWGIAVILGLGGTVMIALAWHMMP